MRNTSFVRFLVITNILLVGCCALFLLASFTPHETNGRFNEISAERINIIGENNKPVMVISNNKNIPGPSMNGKTYSRDVIDGRKYFSGILFFNELGDEVGGLIYAGIKKDSTRYSSVGHLSFDQWKQNQVLALDYNGNEKSQSTGLRIWDRPHDIQLDQELDLQSALIAARGKQAKTDSIRKAIDRLRQSGGSGIERMFIGSKDNVTQIQLKDKNGKTRGRFYISDSGEAKLDFLDEKGETTATFPRGY